MTKNSPLPEQPSNTHGSRSFRSCLGTYGTGVAVVTTCTTDGELRGLTVNSFSSLSLDPPLILWSIGRNVQSFSSFMDCQRFAINVLAADQIQFAKRFSASGGNKFQTVAHLCGIGGVPLLPDCTAWFECSVAARHDAGDHVIIIGHVDRFESSGRPGLLFIAGSFYSANAIASVSATSA